MLRTCAVDLLFFGAVFLRLQRLMLSPEETMRMWEVGWAQGEHFHVLVATALLLSQRSAILQPRMDTAKLHQYFATLNRSLYAAELTSTAQRLQSQPRVRAVLEQAMLPLSDTPRISVTPPVRHIV